VVRLTGGAWRGRKLEVPDGIRPTTELARKAAFDILGEDVRGARVLDACAGSGAYGLEALSRGAAHATFVEEDRKVAKVLRGNVEHLDAGARALIEEMSVTRFSLKREEGRTAPRASGRLPAFGGASGIPFDVIFHDPPFKEISEADLQLLLKLVRPAGWLFHERGDDEVCRPMGLAPADRRRYGTTRFLIFRPPFSAP
jgi:16S rRNA (guanine966-N2)-methyltransferase